MKQKHQTTKAAKKLALNKQTIRELNHGELAQNAGGAPVSDKETRNSACLCEC